MIASILQAILPAAGEVVDLGLDSEAKSLSTGFWIRYTHNTNAPTKNFYLSVSFNPHSDHPVEFFPNGRGKVEQKLETEPYELGVQTHVRGEWKWFVQNATKEWCKYMR